MKIKIFVLICIAFIANSLVAQSEEVDKLVKEGVKYYDNGDFKAAIKSYEEALKLEPNSLLVNYEIAMTYFALKDYEKAIEHSDVVIQNNTLYLDQAFVVKGSSQDLLGKPDDAIKTYKSALKDYPDNYLLHYNLGLTYYNSQDLKNAEKSVQKALGHKSNHASSHMLLSLIMLDKKSRVKALLALYNFLLIEPKGKRASNALNQIKIQTSKGVTKDGEKTINIQLLDTKDTDEFKAAEMMISMLEASKNLEENIKKSEQELFVENTSSFFSVLGELKKEQNGFWWDYYVSYFYAMKKENHVEALCYYISQSKKQADISKWLEENTDKVDALLIWNKDYERKY